MSIIGRTKSYTLRFFRALITFLAGSVCTSGLSLIFGANIVTGFLGGNVAGYYLGAYFAKRDYDRLKIEHFEGAEIAHSNFNLGDLAFYILIFMFLWTNVTRYIDRGDNEKQKQKITEKQTTIHRTYKNVRRILFQSSPRHNLDISINTINEDGTGLKVIYFDKTSEDRNPIWAPDGKWIVFKSYINSKRGEPFTLNIIKPDGTELNRIIYQSHPISSPSWSPDGKKFFVLGKKLRTPSHVDDFFLIYDTEIKTTNKITIDPNIDNPKWSPDGKWIVFSSIINPRRGDAFILNIIKPDGTELNRIIIKSHPIRVPAWFSWSPDGKKFVVDEGDFFLIYDTESKTKTKTSSFSCFYCSPIWADNKFIFEIRDNFGSKDKNDEIYSMNLDGSNKINLTKNKSDDKLIYWFPRRKRILFKSNRRTGFLFLNNTEKYFTMNMDGSDVKRYNKIPQLGILSPDGEKIVYEKKSKIYIMDLDGNNQKEIAIGQNPSWEPNPT